MPSPRAAIPKRALQSVFFRLMKLPLLLRFGLVAATILVSPLCFATYTPPDQKLNDPHLRVYFETSTLTDTPVLEQIRRAQDEFQSLQENSPALKLTSSPAVLGEAAAQIAASLKPALPIATKDIQSALHDAIISRKGSGLGYGGLSFPEVHVWTKASLKKIFQRGDHPPGLTLDAQTQMLNLDFVAQSGALNPITLVIDESLSAEQRKAATSDFFRYWIDTVRRTQDSVADVLIFTAVRDVTLKYLNDQTKLPAWFRLGAANLIAYNGCAKLLGEGAAEHALNLCIGPHSLPKPAAALKAATKSTELTSEEKPVERACFELCRDAQASTDKTFIRLVLAAADKAQNRSQTDEQIIEIYRSVAASNKKLFDA